MINRIVKLNIQVGKATSGPPLGPVLGQFKIPMMEFCKDFNEKTKIFNENLYMKVLLFIYDDNTYSYAVRFPRLSYFIKSLLDIELLNGLPGNFIMEASKDVEQLSKSYGIISPMMIYELVKFYKSFYYKDKNDIAIYRILVASIKSMGIYININNN